MLKETLEVKFCKKKFLQPANYISRWTRRREEQIQSNRRWNGPDDGWSSRILSEFTTSLLKLPYEFLKLEFWDENKILTYWNNTKVYILYDQCTVRFFLSRNYLILFCCLYNIPVEKVDQSIWFFYTRN